MDDTTQRTRRRKIFGGLTVLVTFIVFLPSLANGFVWDDHLLILRNANVQTKPLFDVWFLRLWDASGVSDSMLNPLYADVYRPWITFCYAVLFRIFGDDAFAYHALNLIVHLGTTLAVYLWLSDRKATTPPALVAIATLLFAIHPSKVESVAWISGSTDVWMGLFLLLVLLARTRLSGAARFWVLGLAFALAIFSKETAIVLLGWLLAEDYLFGSLRKNGRDYLALGLSVLVALGFRTQALSGSGSSLLERLPHDAYGVMSVASTYGHYLRQTFVFWDPAVQPSYRHYAPSHAPIFETWSVMVGGVFVLGALALSIRNLRKPPLLPKLYLGVLFFTLLLLPVSNIVRLDTESLTADRFLYLPVLGLSLLSLFAIDALWRSAWQYRRWLLMGLSSAALLSFGSVSIQHIETFSSDLKLRENSLERDPGNMYAMYLVAGHKRNTEAREILVQGQRQAVSEGRYEMALKFTLGAMRLLAAETADFDQETLKRLFDGYESLEKSGTLSLRHASMNLDARLAKPLHKAMLSNVSDYLQPYAAVAARTGHFESAERLLKKAVSISDKNGQLRADLAVLLAKKGEWAQAQAMLSKAEAALPGDERLAAARQLLERALALHRAVPSLPLSERELAKVYEPLAVTDLRTARQAYAALWAESGPTPPLLNAAIQVELADRLADRARAVLDKARTERPDLEAYWSQLEAEIMKADIPSPRTVW